MQRPSPAMLGVLLAVACYAVYAWSDATIKGLGASVGIFEIGFFMTIFSIVPAFFTKPAGERWRDTFRLSHPWLVQLISVGRVASAVLVTYSFITIPLAEVYAIVFMIPVFITILSVLVLKEEVGVERWILIAVSFTGVLLVVRPGFRELELGHLTAFACAISSAVSTTATRLISAREKRTSLFMIPALYTLLVNGILMLAAFKMPSLLEFGGLLVAGLLGGIGYLLQITALQKAPASRVAPMQYSQIVWALLLGALFFAEVPDLTAIAGIVVVVAAGIVGIFSDGARARIAGRFAEYRARRKGANPEPPPIPGPPEV